MVFGAETGRVEAWRRGQIRIGSVEEFGVKEVK